MSDTYDDLVTKARATMGDAYIEFTGMNCNDVDPDAHCIGWDGVSRRCSCGNRRVYWAPNEDGTAVYPEAW